MEEQNHSVNDSEMGNPSILSVLFIFCNPYSNVYFALYVLSLNGEWINKQTNRQTNLPQTMTKFTSIAFRRI